MQPIDPTNVCDRDVYIAVVAQGDEIYIPETALAATTAERLCADIFDGQYDGLLAVVRCQPAAGTAAVADAEVAERLADLSFRRLCTPSDDVQGWITAFGLRFYEEDWYRAERDPGRRFRRRCHPRR